MQPVYWFVSSPPNFFYCRDSSAQSTGDTMISWCSMRCCSRSSRIGWCQRFHQRGCWEVNLGLSVEWRGRGVSVIEMILLKCLKCRRFLLRKQLGRCNTQLGGVDYCRPRNTPYVRYWCKVTVKFFVVCFFFFILHLVSNDFSGKIWGLILHEGVAELWLWFLGK